ncbi:hypothetical protein ACTXG6_06665 [Pseudonocardia sp. Cha107L01]|uniref:hypothetical protein n=1 Tax=Pseudonocardia sp. Cha107L01 TaxID=3457576 RepID=UPI00403E42BF
MRPHSQEAGPLESVRARVYLLAGNHTVLLEAAEWATTVLTVSPGAAKGEVITSVTTSDLEPGDFILLRQRTGDEDTLAMLANKILGERCGALRGQQQRWKSALRRAVHLDGVHRATRRLHELGCNANNLGRWLSPDGIRTQSKQDFTAICLYAGITEADAGQIWVDMGVIHGAHIRAGHQMRELLENQLQLADLAPLQTCGYLEVHLPALDAGALAIYRVEAKDRSTVDIHPSKLRIPQPAGRL